MRREDCSIIATLPDSLAVLPIGKFFPVPPAPGALEAPLSGCWAGQEKRPAGLVLNQLNSVQCRGSSERKVPSDPMNNLTIWQVL